MAMIRDVINSIDPAKDKQSEIKEELEILLSLAKNKAEIHRRDIEDSLKEGKIHDDLYVPITKVLGRHSEYRAVTNNDPAHIIGKVSGALENIIGGGTKEIIGGCASIVSTAVNAILGEGAGEESEESSYIILAEYPSIVRYDFRFWGRNLEASGIRSICSSAMSVVAYKSAVDVQALTFNGFLSAYGQVLNKSSLNKDDIKKMIEESKEIYKLFLDNEKFENSLKNDFIINDSDTELESIVTDY